jgi:adenine-specific DNA-methyltransferase
MVRHAEATRTNIPTNETGGFLTPEQKAPTMVRYPRDPSLDPQLVWKGKDEEDREPLTVPAVPIYIQEKIHPKALIEQLRAEQRDIDPQASLFADFNGISFEQLVEFYQHPQHWTNRLILGDSLLVMASLADKEQLRGQVQTVYIDPPYGIRFNSNWQVSTRNRDVTDGKPADLTRQVEQVKAFRDTWKNGLHSYLSYLRQRLYTARDLLHESGSVFVQIGEENVHLVRCLLDEVFGPANFVSLVTYSKTSGATAELLPGTADYILWYAKNRDVVKYRRLFALKAVGGVGGGKYDQLELADGTRRAMTAAEKSLAAEIPDGARPYRLDNLTSQSVGREKGEGAASWFAVTIDGRAFYPTMRSRWKTNEPGMESLLAARRIQVTGNSLAYVRFIDDFPAFPITNTWMDIGGIQSRADPKVYVVQTATSAVERCILMTTDPGDLVLDPTCGSATTAYVAEQWGRRWITIDTSRVALALARQRLMAARYPYYLLATDGTGSQEHRPPGRGDITRGFQYRTVPHITLKSIATNPDIAAANGREDVERAIRRHADQEVLRDQPHEDRKVVRVAGPFTVESLSPHVTLPLEDGHVATDADGDPGDDGLSRFHRIVLEHLAKSGVQTATGAERLRFSSLETWPGKHIHAVGDYDDSKGHQRAAICVGPEYGTVDADLVRAAAREAAGVFDLLVVCGFAFDGYIAGELRQLGNLPVLKAAMNPDLTMGDELLKKSGSANLFMVFGEPDIQLTSLEPGCWQVEVRGVDVYNPTTGELRSHSTEDLACWFIDTSYNSVSFFVRHAYFYGGNRPYEQLQRALRADISESVWESLYTTTSRPFRHPASGKIAVKVINIFGDEVMKVLELPEAGTRSG